MVEMIKASNFSKSLETGCNLWALQFVKVDKLAECDKFQKLRARSPVLFKSSVNEFWFVFLVKIILFLNQTEVLLDFAFF